MLNPKDSEKVTVYVKGAPEILLQRCNQFLGSDGPQHLDRNTSSTINSEINQMAKKTLRVIGFAYAEITKK